METGEPNGKKAWRWFWCVGRLGIAVYLMSYLVVTRYLSHPIWAKTQAGRPVLVHSFFPPVSRVDYKEVPEFFAPMQQQYVPTEACHPMEGVFRFAFYPLLKVDRWLQTWLYYSLVEWDSHGRIVEGIAGQTPIPGDPVRQQVSVKWKGGSDCVTPPVRGLKREGPPRRGSPTPSPAPGPRSPAPAETSRRRSGWGWRRPGRGGRGRRGAWRPSRS